MNQNTTAVELIPQDVGEIVSSLVKVKLRIGGAATSVRSRELSGETARAHGAKEQDITTQIKWLAREYTADIGAAYSRLRSGFNARTLPWEDGGYRAVPADRYQALCDFVAEAGEQYRAAGQKVADEWDAAIAEAKGRLNGLMAKMNIPSRDEFISAFAFDFRSDVIVAPADMRVAGIAEAQISRIRAQAEADYADRIQNGVDSMLATLTELLTELVGRTGKEKQDGVRYGGWAERAKKAVAAMRHLNITDDARLAGLLDRVKLIAEGMDAEAVRENGRERAKVRTDAVDALDCFGVK